MWSGKGGGKWRGCSAATSISARVQRPRLLPGTNVHGLGLEGLWLPLCSDCNERDFIIDHFSFSPWSTSGLIAKVSLNPLNKIIAQTNKINERDISLILWKKKKEKEKKPYMGCIYIDIVWYKIKMNGCLVIWSTFLVVEKTRKMVFEDEIVWRLYSCGGYGLFNIYIYVCVCVYI